MNRFWPKLLISQLFLAVCLINLITALTHDDSRPLTVENIAADLLWYVGLLAQLPESPKNKMRHKAATATVLAGALLLASVAACRIAGIAGLISSLEMLLAFLLAVPILYGLGLGLAFLKRKASPPPS